MRAVARAGRRQRSGGVAVIEFALLLPLLVVLTLAVVELGRAILTRQVLINLSREAANLCSRGTAFNDAINAIQVSSAPLNLRTDGYVILTEVFRDANGRVTIRKQSAAGARPQASHIGSGIGSNANLPPSPTPIPPNNQNGFIAEVFYVAVPITPLGNLMNFSLGTFYYDVAFF